MEMNDTTKPLTRKDVKVRKAVRLGAMLVEDKTISDWVNVWLGDRNLATIRKRTEVPAGYWGRYHVMTGTGRGFYAETQKEAIQHVINKFNEQNTN